MTTIEQLEERLKIVTQILTEELERISAEIDTAKNKPSAISPAEELAIRIHARTCRASHAVDCAWFYEIHDGVHDWEAPTHKRYLKKANQVLL